MSPLTQFTVLSTVTLAQIADNASGVAYSPVTGTLFVVNNGNEDIFEYDPSGHYLRTIPTDGWDDVESICWMRGNQFAIIEEGNATVSVITITADTVRLNKADAEVIDTGLGPLANNGLEGITYDAARDRFYAVRERQGTAPSRNGMRVYQILRNGTTTTLFDAPAVLDPSITDLADCCFDPNSQRLYLLSQEAQKIIAVSLTGTVLETSTLPAGMNQPEGLTFNESGTRLWIVGEPAEMRITGTTIAGTTPVTPAEFEALRPDPEDTLCDLLIKAAKMDVLNWKLWRWVRDNEGELTPDFQDAICEAAKRPLAALTVDQSTPS